MLCTLTRLVRERKKKPYRSHRILRITGSACAKRDNEPLLLFVALTRYPYDNESFPVL